MGSMIKKIFITGGLGLIGKELIKNLNNFDYELTVTDLNKQLKRYKKKFVIIQEMVAAFKFKE